MATALAAPRPPTPAPPPTPWSLTGEASAGRGSLDAMLRSLTLRDDMTARHSAAVARFARELAKAAGAGVDQQLLVHTAGLLHDIGKLMLSDSILRTSRSLSERDWELVRRHPAAGAEIVARVPGHELIARAIRHHHERIDGTGYPDGLSGDEIPWSSRVIAVADTYDVMTSRGSYSRPKPAHEAVAELERVAGAQLDAALVGTFVELLERRDVTLVRATAPDPGAELPREHRLAFC